MMNLLDPSTIVLIFQVIGVGYGMIRGYVSLIRRLDRIENKIDGCPHVDEKITGPHHHHGSQPLNAHHL